MNYKSEIIKLLEKADAWQLKFIYQFMRSVLARETD